MKYSTPIRIGRKRTATSSAKKRTNNKRLYPNRPMFNQIKLGIHSFKRTTPFDSELGLSLSTPAATGGEIQLMNEGFRFIIDRNGSLVAGSMNYASFSLNFQIGSIPFISEFSSLFDSYRIRKVVVKIQSYGTVAMNPPGSAGQTYPNVSPMVHWVIDNDDNTLPTADAAGIDTLREYPSYRVRRLISDSDKPITIVLKPKTLTSTQTSGGTYVGPANAARNLWLDIAVNTAPHYGIKGIIQGINPQNSQVFSTPVRAETTYYFQCKGVR